MGPGYGTRTVFSETDFCRWNKAQWPRVGEGPRCHPAVQPDPPPPTGHSACVTMQRGSSKPAPVSETDTTAARGETAEGHGWATWPTHTRKVHRFTLRPGTPPPTELATRWPSKQGGWLPHCPTVLSSLQVARGPRGWWLWTTAVGQMGNLSRRNKSLGRLRPSLGTDNKARGR